jgi:integrase
MDSRPGSIAAHEPFGDLGGDDGAVPLAAALAVELARWPRHGRLVDLESGQTVAHRIRLAMRRHGVDGRPHDLRAAFATAASNASNGNVVVVARLMSHAAIATTMRYIAVDAAGSDVVDRLFTDDLAERRQRRESA